MTVIENEQKNNTNQLSENLKKRKVYWSFKDNVCGAHLADMQLIRKYSKGFLFLLSIINIFSKYAWVVPLSDKKVIIITYALQKYLDESNHKPDKIWLDKGWPILQYTNEIMVTR